MKDLQRELVRLGDTCAILIISPENRRYFTSFPSSNGFLLVNADRAVFITDGRYIEAAEKQAQNCEVVLQKRIFPQIAEILKEMNCRHLLVEASRMNLDFYNSLKGSAKDVKILTDTSLDSMINTFRSVKTKDELDSIKAAQKITDDAFSHICTFIKEGVTEKEIGLELDFYMLSHGGEALSFETIAISGENTSMPHGVPGERHIQNGDFITMDFGTVVNGYHSDMTRTVAVGYATDEMKTVYETVKKAQEKCISGIKAGLTGIECDALARDVIKSGGFGEYFTHSTGHGVGIEIHEFPNLNLSNDIPLVPGQIVTVEPGIYIPNKFGVRIEDMVCITENGCEDLTGSPKDLIIL